MNKKLRLFIPQLLAETIEEMKKFEHEQDLTRERFQRLELIEEDDNENIETNEDKAQSWSR